MAETMRDVANGRASAWCYRTWLTPGIDIAGFEINRWQMPELIDNPRRTQLANWGHAGSLHGEGAYVLMADGSTRFLSQETDRTVRERLAMIADGEIVDSP
jgi:prepilin-type processing-associated H-X9-DG protein